LQRLTPRPAGWISPQGLGLAPWTLRLLPRLAPSLVILQQPIQLGFHPAAHLIEPQAATGPSIGTGAGPGPGAGHPIHQLTAGAHPLVEPLLEAGLSAGV